MFLVRACLHSDETQDEVTTKRKNQISMHRLLVLQGHMTLDHILFNTNALISQSNCYVISLEYADMERFLASQAAAMINQCTGCKIRKYVFPSEQKKCTKCHFKSIIYILKGVWCFPRIVRQPFCCSQDSSDRLQST